MTTNWMAESSRNELPHSSGAQKSGTKVAGGSAPSGGPEGICSRPLSWPLDVTSDPWCGLDCGCFTLIPASTASWCFLPCLLPSPSLPFLTITFHPNPGWHQCFGILCEADIHGGLFGPWSPLTWSLSKPMLVPKRQACVHLLGQDIFVELRNLVTYGLASLDESNSHFLLIACFCTKAL